ncbi:hypothetical protein U0028_07670 [Pseudomonas putida]|uniref:hypothetical protein n=1 Tax=Pseudomonas putida TaxID=303 RepID=UPI0013B40DC7|nr:hypothetical protein [Pseudomonas putida]WQE55540.1 hypothetical protein U0028_07670 [Pseudomonas putida]HDS1006895.1 hypothetical protein [Pseudomonas putida]
MISICITGNSHKHIKEASSNLSTAGLKGPLPSGRDQEINLDVWHTQVFKLKNASTESVHVGKLWERVAIDIFLANRNQDAWHWANMDSLYLADYWLSFDSGIHFLLIYTPFEDCISSETPGTPPNAESIAENLAKWRKTTQVMFELHERHPKRCLLVNSREFARRHSNITAQLDMKFNISLNPINSWSSSNQNDNILSLLLRNHTFKDLATSNLSESNTISPENYGPDEINSAISNYLDMKQALDLLKNSELNESSPAPKAPENTDSELLEEISELESDNSLLLSQLHESQAEYEKYLIKTHHISNSLKQISKRLNKVLDAHPEYWECDEITVTTNQTSKTLNWKILNSYLIDTNFKEISFQTITEDKEFSLKFFKDSPASCPFERWPSFPGDDLVICHPTENTTQNLYLNLLGPTDWSRLDFLIARIAGYCKAGLLPKNIKSATKNKMMKGLIDLQAHLRAWPLILRYDSLEVVNVAHIGEYQSIGISLKNVQLGQLQVSSFDYRLSTFNEPGQPFGTHPRLEFPESCRTVFHSWFPESSDERGARLELRFSQPNEMDTNIWSKLNGSDQVFIAALISNLHIQLKQARLDTPKLNTSWEEWEKIARFMKSTLSSIYLPKTLTTTN